MRTASDSLFAKTLGVIVCLSLALPAHAPAPDMPSGAGTPSVVHGGAVFDRNGDNLTVTTNSNRTIINWDRFSVPGGSLTHFAQPGVNAATLNRVQGSLPTRIDGTLSSNGAVFITNAQGVVVGSQGVIRTDGGFVASSLNLSNADFLGGGPNGTAAMRFGGGGGVVENHGVIESARGDVFLIGTRVGNYGAVRAANGTAGFAAGSEVVIHPLNHAGGRVEVVATAASFADGTGVDNSGIVSAASAELRAHGDAYRLAVRNSGVIQARGVERTPDGRVFLTGLGRGGKAAGAVVNSGTVRAVNADGSGGAAYITGESATLAAGSLVDVSAERGDGGAALIGGAFQGGKHGDGTELLVPNARELVVEDGARVVADGAGAGDGGLAVLWSDVHTDFAGHVSARGGADGGDGGFAEVSGKETLSFTGTADTAGGTGGRTGTLLLDPADVTIKDMGGTINSADLVNALNSNNVVVYTDSAENGTGNIAVEEKVEWAGDNSLTLLAYNNIILFASVRNFTEDGNQTALGDLTMVAGWDGTTGIPAGSPSPSYAGLFAMPALPTSQADFAAATWFGDTTGRNVDSLFGGDYSGSIVLVGNSSSGESVNVGSRHGTTTLLANDVTLQGDMTGYAHIGYKASNRVMPLTAQQTASGDIGVYAKGDVRLKGSHLENGYAQIGHGGGLYSSDGSSVGYILNAAGAEIMVLSGGNLVLTGGDGANAYTQIGHGGAISGSGTRAMIWGGVGAGMEDVSVIANGIALSGGSGANALAFIGSGTANFKSDTSDRDWIRPTAMSGALGIRATSGGVTLADDKTSIMHSGSGAFSLLSKSALTMSGDRFSLASHTGTAAFVSEAGLTQTGTLAAGGNLHLLSGWNGTSGWSGTVFDPTATVLSATPYDLSIAKLFVTTGGLTARSSGGITVGDVVDIGKAGYFKAAGDVTLSGDAQIASSLSTTGNAAILVDAGGKFVNASSRQDQALKTDAGSWLVWTGNAADSVANGLGASAAQRQFGVAAAPSVAYVGGSPTISRSDVNLAGSGFLITGAAPTVTVTAKDGAGIYGDAPTNDWGHVVGSASGTVLGDSAADVLAAINAANVGYGSSATAASGVGTYTTTVSGLTSSLGYGFNYVDGSYVIGRRDITVTATASRQYGAANPLTPGFVVGGKGLANNDALAGSVVYGADGTTVIGDYGISQGSVNNLNNPNYNIDWNDGVLSITPREILVSADKVVKLWGEEYTLPLTWSFDSGSMANNDWLELALSSAGTGMAAGVGLYAVDADSIVVHGVDAANYTIRYEGGDRFAVVESGAVNDPWDKPVLLPESSDSLSEEKRLKDILGLMEELVAPRGEAVIRKQGQELTMIWWGGKWVLLSPWELLSDGDWKNWGRLMEVAGEILGELREEVLGEILGELGGEVGWGAGEGAERGLERLILMALMGEDGMTPEEAIEALKASHPDVDWDAWHWNGVEWVWTGESTADETITRTDATANAETTPPATSSTNETTDPSATIIGAGAIDIDAPLTVPEGLIGTSPTTDMASEPNSAQWTLEESGPDKSQFQYTQEQYQEQYQLTLENIQLTPENMQSMLKEATTNSESTDGDAATLDSTGGAGVNSESETTDPSETIIGTGNISTPGEAIKELYHWSNLKEMNQRPDSKWYESRPTPMVPSWKAE